MRCDRHLASDSSLGSRIRLCTALCLAAVAALLAGCGNSASEPAMHVSESVPRLTALLSGDGIRVGTHQPNPGSIRSAWKAFKEFAQLPVSRSDLSADPMADAMLFEFGTFDFGGKWGKTFEVDFVRQFEMQDGDLQQVHLVAHFRPQVFEDVMRRIGVRPCDSGADCAGRCAYVGSTDLLGEPCTFSSRAHPGDPDRRFESAHVWSYDMGGTTASSQRASWIEFVGKSPALLAVLARAGRPLGYEVWRESAE